MCVLLLVVKFLIKTRNTLHCAGLLVAPTVVKRTRLAWSFPKVTAPIAKQLAAFLSLIADIFEQTAPQESAPHVQLKTPLT